MSQSEFIDPTLLFRFEIDLHRSPLVMTKAGVQLPEVCSVPHFGALAGGSTFGDLRLAWDSKGIGFWLSVKGKKQVPWCRETRLTESDGLRLFIDTRNSSKARRANRFCHVFIFSPLGGGVKRDQAVGGWIPMEQARELGRPVDQSVLSVHAKIHRDGYEVSGLIPGEAMTGFDPVESPRIGLFYQVIDRELGRQTFSVGADYPVFVDPSLWGDARLVS